MASRDYTGERTLVTEHIIGYRVWYFDPYDLRLRSLNGESWNKGELTAVCKAGNSHPTIVRPTYDHEYWSQDPEGFVELQYEYQSIPAPGCTCGIYARYFPQDIDDLMSWTHGITIAGAIAASGNIELGSRGFRAEKAKILAVFCGGASDYELVHLSKSLDIELFHDFSDLINKYPPSNLSSLLFPNISSAREQNWYEQYHNRLAQAMVYYDDKSNYFVPDRRHFKSTKRFDQKFQSTIKYIGA